MLTSRHPPHLLIFSTPLLTSSRSTLRIPTPSCPALPPPNTQVDPFFVPTTEEEREEWGEEASNLGTNLAKRLIDATRRRKGLPVEEKVVKAATKQRTLKRNV